MTSGEFPLSDPAHAAVFIAAFVGVILVTSRRGGPLRAVAAWSVVACSLLISGIVLAGLQEGQAVWLFSFGSYLVALLIARGNPVIGGTGIQLIALAGGVWAAITGQDVVSLLAVLTMTFSACLVGFLWWGIVGYVVRREQRARSEVDIAGMRATAAHLAEAEFRQGMASIALDVEPVMKSLADGEPVDDDLRRLIVVVEGDVRDRIRAADLRDESLASAIAGARWRGSRVVLLGHNVADVPLASAGIERLVAMVEDPSMTSITIRRLPPDRGAVVSVATQTPSSSTLVLLDEHGRAAR